MGARVHVPRVCRVFMCIHEGTPGEVTLEKLRSEFRNESWSGVRQRELVLSLKRQNSFLMLEDPASCERKVLEGVRCGVSL